MNSGVAGTPDADAMPEQTLCLVRQEAVREVGPYAKRALSQDGRAQHLYTYTPKRRRTGEAALTSGKNGK